LTYKIGFHVYFYRTLDEESIKKRRRNIDLDWSRYWSLDEVNEWMDSIVASNPQSVSAFKIGLSSEGRIIRGVKMNLGGGKGKKAIFFESLIHASEWVTYLYFLLTFLYSFYF
jgi:hypothetical protein